MNLDPEEIKDIANVFQENLDYVQSRISLLNRRACLHKDEPCGQRARNVITGMIDVINALGFEVVGEWDDYKCNFQIVPAFEAAEANERNH